MSLSSRYGIRKHLSGFAALMLLVFVVFASLYIAHETVHECHGESCPVCECIAHCRSALEQAGAAFVYIVAVSFAPVFCINEFRLGHELLTHTPVDRKVRLND